MTQFAKKSKIKNKFQNKFFSIFFGPGPNLDPSPGPKNENWAKQKNIPIELCPMMSETQKIQVEMLLGTDTAAPKFQFRLPKKHENGPPAETGGVGEFFFSFKTPTVMIKCTIQMENTKY